MKRMFRMPRIVPQGVGGGKPARPYSSPRACPLALCCVHRPRFLQTHRGEAEGIDDLLQTPGICRGDAHEKVDIIRQSGPTVEADGVPPDENVLNLFRIQQFDKRAQILLQLHQGPPDARSRGRVRYPGAAAAALKDTLFGPPAPRRHGW